MFFSFLNTNIGRENKENVYNIYKKVELKYNSVVKHLPTSHKTLLYPQSEEKQQSMTLDLAQGSSSQYSCNFLIGFLSFQNKTFYFKSLYSSLHRSGHI